MNASTVLTVNAASAFLEAVSSNRLANTLNVTLSVSNTLILRMDRAFHAESLGDLLRMQVFITVHDDLLLA